MKNKTGRFSGYIRPFSYLLDLIIVNLFSYLILFPNQFSPYFAFFVSIAWVVIAINVDFYEVYRFTKVLSIVNKLIKQFVLFTICCFAFLGFYFKNIDSNLVLSYSLYCLAFVLSAKFGVYFFLRKYRELLGGNLRRVVIVGKGKDVEQLATFFKENPDYGYKLVQIFDLKKGSTATEDLYEFVTKNTIDEIYCSLDSLSNEQINNIIDFADNNLKILKFLADNNEFFSRKLKLDYYGYIPILSLRNIPLDIYTNKLIKRGFDIVFSLFVIVGFLSWMTPLLAILIKLESKGPVFFLQKRNGLNYREFFCIKFRSMNLNEIADLEQVSKNDPRITTVGKIIRKTSIDELPQFFNVLVGDMSVVGPRPHMVSHTEMYAQKVDKFMVRHFIKPGITGLAQTNGYRGEVENDKDIIYRVKYDIYYVENWSLLLDIKIVIATLINAIKGEEKAY